MTAIETDGLAKQYGAVTAIRDVTMTVTPGEVYGFLGPNGAGKSTTIAILLDYARPTAGTARIFGMDPQRRQVEIGRRVGVLPERCELYDRLSGRKHLAFAIRAMDAADDPDELLERVGLAGAGDRPVGTYSTGMTQRLKLALALVGDPSLLILDEPSSGLDPHGIKRLREIVTVERDRGTAVFFSSHVLEQVEAVCDRIGIMVAGRLVVSGDLESLKADVRPTVQLTVTVDTVPPTLREALESMPVVTALRMPRSRAGGTVTAGDSSVGSETTATGDAAVGSGMTTTGDAAVSSGTTTTGDAAVSSGTKAGSKPTRDPNRIVVSIADETAKAAVLRRVEEHATIVDFSAERGSLETLFERYAREDR